MIDVEAEQAFATECIVREDREEGMQQGRQQGMQQGMQQGKVNIIENLLKEGIITKEEAEKQLAKI